MTPALDAVTLGASEPLEAQTFYASVLSPDIVDHGEFADLNLRGAGHVGLRRADALAAEAGEDPATSGFRGYVMSYIVSQPSEVESILAAAVAGGGTVLKPAKKSMFAGFAAVFRAPDGAIWKLAAATRKDTGPAQTPPEPSETGVILGVDEPKASKDFYTALGMTVDRDYGSKFIDFELRPGTFRLGLMQRPVLAKDAGVGPEGSGFAAAVLGRTVGSREDVDALLEAAEDAGGRIAVPAGKLEHGGYGGHFADPDGFLWRVAAA